MSSSPKYLPLLSALFITLLIISNIIAVKIADLGGFFLPVAVLFFPFSYVLSDILTEVYGYAAMRRVLWTGFFCNLLAVLIMTASVMIPPAPFFEGQNAFAQILGATPRILLASFIAYLIGGFTNAALLARLKVKTEGKYLWLRTIVSTIIGEGLDSALFITIAFAGMFPRDQILQLILMQWLWKTAIEIVVTPVTYALVGFLKRREGIDYFDRGTNFNPLAL